MEINVNETIELLCDKFGIAVNEASKLIPEIVKCQSALSLFWAIIFAIATAVCVYMVRIACLHAKKDFEDLWFDEGGAVEFVVALVCTIAGVCAFLAFCFNLCDLISWQFAPTTTTLRWVLNQFGG